MSEPTQQPNYRDTIAAMAHAYTRGRGFAYGEVTMPAPDVDAVIATASMRLAANPGQLPIDRTTGPFSESIKAGFSGWTLAELAVLDRYRVRAV